MSEAPALSIIIVTRNSADLIRTCLRRIAESRIEKPFEIIVVDNDSSDGTLDLLYFGEARIRLIAEKVNHGFARANNIGIAAARGKTLLLLNPDAFVEDPDVIGAALAFLDQNPDVAAAGVQLVFPDGRHQVGDAGHAPTARSVLVHGLGLQAAIPRLKSLFLARPGRDRRDVDWICGAFLMVRRSAIDTAGPLDSRFFLYGEDIEWGCRMRDHGLRLAYLPFLRVTHLQGGATSSKTPSMLWMNGIAEVFVRRNPRHFWVLRIALGIGFALRALVYGLRALKTRQAADVSRARAMRRFLCHAIHLSTKAVAS